MQFSRKYKDEIVEAIQWLGSNLSEVELFLGNKIKTFEYENINNPELLATMTGIVLDNPQGLTGALMGDYIIKYADGSHLPCNGEYFTKTFYMVK